MDSFCHPNFLSKTQYLASGLKKPINAETFKKIKNEIPECVLNQTNRYFFQWEQETRIPLINANVLVTNDVELEHAMWLMIDLIGNINKLKEINEKSYNLRIKSLQMIIESVNNINSSTYIETKSSDTLHDLEISVEGDWKNLTKNFRYKIPWYLIPNLNESIKYWALSEKILYEFKLKVHGKSIDKTITEQYVCHYLCAFMILQKGTLNYAYCPAAFQDAYNDEINQKQVFFYIWLSFLYDQGPENYNCIMKAQTIIYKNNVVSTTWKGFEDKVNGMQRKAEATKINYGHYGYSNAPQAEELLARFQESDTFKNFKNEYQYEPFSFL